MSYKTRPRSIKEIRNKAEIVRSIIQITTNTSGDSIDILRFVENEIRDMFLDGQLEFNDEIYITNARHVSELQSAKESFLMVIKSINDDMPEDFYSI